MHIITGLLLSAFNKKGQGKAQSSLHGKMSPVSLTHSISGRVRFHVKALKGTSSKCEELSQQLEKIEGITGVTTDSRTGSLVISHSKPELTPDLLATAIIRILGLERQLKESVRPKFVNESRRIGKALSEAIYDKTGGFVDLYSLVPLIFIGLGVRKIMIDKNNILPTGMTLIWWGYNSLFGGGKSGK